ALGPRAHATPPAPSPERGGQARVRSDRDAVVRRGLNRDAHRAGVAGMEAARDVRRGDHLHERIVAAPLPEAKALAEVRVEIDRTHVAPSYPSACASARAV